MPEGGRREGDRGEGRLRASPQGEPTEIAGTGGRIYRRLDQRRSGATCDALQGARANRGEALLGRRPARLAGGGRTVGGFEERGGGRAGVREGREDDPGAALFHNEPSPGHGEDSARCEGTLGDRELTPLGARCSVRRRSLEGENEERGIEPVVDEAPMSQPDQE